MNTRKSTGPKTLPFGIALVTGFQSEIFLTTSRYCLLERKSLIIRKFSSNAITMELGQVTFDEVPYQRPRQSPGI